jgi:hypothetical protein
LTIATRACGGNRRNVGAMCASVSDEREGLTVVVDVDGEVAGVKGRDGGVLPFQPALPPRHALRNVYNSPWQKNRSA